MLNEKTEWGITLKFLKRFHITSNVLALVLLTTFLVWTFCTLPDLPEKFGMHYGMDGNFDIYSESKIMAFYKLKFRSDSEAKSSDGDDSESADNKVKAYNSDAIQSNGASANPHLFDNLKINDKD